MREGDEDIRAMVPTRARAAEEKAKRVGGERPRRGRLAEDEEAEFSFPFLIRGTLSSTEDGTLDIVLWPRSRPLGKINIAPSGESFLLERCQRNYRSFSSPVCPFLTQACLFFKTRLFILFFQ